MFLNFQKRLEFCGIRHGNKVPMDSAWTLYQGFSREIISYFCRYRPTYKVLRTSITYNQLNFVIYFADNVHVSCRGHRGDLKAIPMDSPQPSIAASEMLSSPTHLDRIHVDHCGSIPHVCMLAPPLHTVTFKTIPMFVYVTFKKRCRQEKFMEWNVVNLLK